MDSICHCHAYPTHQHAGMLLHDYLGLILSMLFLTTLLTKLQVGLAVGDIQAIQKDASLQKLSLQVMILTKLIILFNR